MNIDFEALARDKTDQELEAILARPRDWDRGAVDAARAELSRRGKKVVETKDEPEAKVAVAGLGRNWGALLAMGFGAALIVLGLVVLFVSGPSIAAVSPMVSGAALFIYFATRK